MGLGYLWRMTVDLKECRWERNEGKVTKLHHICMNSQRIKKRSKSICEIISLIDVSKSCYMKEKYMGITRSWWLKFIFRSSFINNHIEALIKSLLLFIKSMWKTESESFIQVWLKIGLYYPSLVSCHMLGVCYRMKSDLQKKLVLIHFKKIL